MLFHIPSLQVLNINCKACQLSVKPTEARSNDIIQNSKNCFKYVCIMGNWPKSAITAENNYFDFGSQLY
jgi:hypothetical protein